MGGTYGNLTGPLLPLDRIVKRLGHVGRRIDVLKVDCEGCEWDAFHHLGTTKAGLAVLENVDTIYLELHLSLQLSTADDLLKFATMYHVLFERLGFQMWWVHPNGARAPGVYMHEQLRRLKYPASVWERGPAPHAWEIGLRRFRRPSGEGVAAGGGGGDGAVVSAESSRLCPSGSGITRGGSSKKRKKGGSAPAGV